MKRRGSRSVGVSLGLALTIGAGVAGCAGLPGRLDSMTADQLREVAKIKDASITCVKANTPYGAAVAVFVNVDKGVVPNGTVTVDDACKTSITTTSPPTITITPAMPTPGGFVR